MKKIGKKKSVFRWFILTVTVVIILGAGYLFLQAEQKKNAMQKPQENPAQNQNSGEQISNDNSGLQTPGGPEDLIDDYAQTESTEEIREPESDEAFVRIKDYIPDVFVELKYSTEDNFTGQKIYDFSDAYLRYGTVKKLKKVQEELGQKGLSIKIWDAFRPVAAQFTLWEVYPDSTYVANPNKGYSSHSRGNTIDITLVDKKGEELVMPTKFDDFSSKADRDYSDCSKEAASNAKMLEQLMEEYGFKGYSGEWWHYTDQESYPVEKNFDCKEE